MEEIFTAVEEMMGDVFNQGMAYQRLLDAQTDMNRLAESVIDKWDAIKAQLEPGEQEQVQ